MAYKEGGLVSKVELTNTSGVTIGDVDITDRAARDLGQVDIADALPAGENHIGEVGTNHAVKTVTLSLDDATSYASGDVLAATQEITDAFRVSGGTAVLKSVALLDKDDTTGSLDLVFLGSNVAIGTENSAVGITDANAEEVLTVVSVVAADYIDLVNSHFAAKNEYDDGMGIVLKPSSSTTSLWVGAICRDAIKHTSSSIVASIGLARN